MREKTGVLAIIALCFLSAGQVSVRAQTSARNHFLEIPFELVRDQILIEVKIGGKGPFTMLLDTDTDPSAIDLETARDLGLSAGSKAYQGGGTDKNVTFSTKIPSVELGNLSARNIVAGTIDLKKISERIGKPIHGVLGYSFLKDRIVQIDYPAQKVRFYDDTPYPGIQNAPNMVNRIALAFRYDQDVLIDSVFINGEKMRATLDTGSSGSLALTPEAIKILGLDEEVRDGETKTAVGYNGEYQNKTGILKSVRLGRLSLESVVATFWLPGTGHDKARFQVNIGNGFMKDFVVTFDFPGKLVVLEMP